MNTPRRPTTLDPQPQETIDGVERVAMHIRDALESVPNLPSEIRQVLIRAEDACHSWISRADDANAAAKEDD